MAMNICVVWLTKHEALAVTRLSWLKLYGMALGSRNVLYLSMTLMISNDLSKSGLIVIYVKPSYYNDIFFTSHGVFNDNYGVLHGS
jgi:hypothetical protein